MQVPDTQTGAESSQEPPPHGVRRSYGREPAWFVLVVSAVGNTVASAAGAAVEVHLVLGLLVASSGGWLIKDHVRSGR